MHVDLREFRSAYLAEVDEHLSAVNALLLDVDSAAREGRAAPREVRELMRLMHTIKGLSAMVAVEPIVAIAHRMEAVLRAADKAGGAVRERALDGLLRAVRAIEARVKAVAEGQAVTEPPTELVAELDALGVLDAPAEEAQPLPSLLDPAIAEKLTASEREQLAQGASSGRRAIRIDFAPSPAKAEAGLTITSVRERLTKLGDLVKVVPIASPATEDAPGGLIFALLLVTDAKDEAITQAAGAAPDAVRVLLAAERPSPKRAAPSATRGAPAMQDIDETATPGGRAGVLRVEVGRVDDAIEKLSALIVTRWRLQRAVDALTASGAPTRELQAILADNARQLRDMRAAILRVRMVPIAAVLERIPLVVRGLGKATGKQVSLVLEAGGAELDKTVGERIFPALVHILRNAVDHGLETPEERERSGKPREGTLRIVCAAQNRMVEIRIEDDGRGVNRQAVARSAGAPVPEDDAALLALMCRPGLSTRAEADVTSGRGLGMDIVRKIVVDSLGGELSLETTQGRGTTFTVRVPLTIAIVDAFVAMCAGERYVVPVSIVEEIVELDHAQLVRAPSNGRFGTGRFFARRGETFPVVDLGEALSVTRSSGKHALVVRRTHDDPIAFAIDRVVGQQEAVIRPFADPLVAVPGVSGSTDLGDGRATLVLDLHGLVARLGTSPPRALPAGHAA